MKNILIVMIFIASCTGISKEQSNEHDHEKAGATTSEKKAKSPKTAAMAIIGSNHIHIEYSAPSTRGRQIFGGLIAYGEVWVTGAHNATNITFDKDVIINGENIEAGKYGFFTVPDKEKWTIIINKDWDMHLADDYKPENDVLRFEVPTKELDESIETLTFQVLSDNDNSGKVTIEWANVEVAFEITNK
jgi:hypothetical protein